MNRKIAITLMIAVIAIASGYGYLRSVVPSPQKQQSRPSPNLVREDKLAKSDKEAVEENINGYSIEDDLKITRTTPGAEKNRISSLSQKQHEQMMENIGSKKMNTVLQEYHTTLPEAINNKVQYFEYNISYDYFLITAENGTEIRESPTPDAAIVARAENLDKLSLLQRVESSEVAGSAIWYRVAGIKDNQKFEGYLHSSTGTPRLFRFDRMLTAVNGLRQQVAQGALHSISNYKNQNGVPPQKGERAVDEHGYRSYHSAPAYEQANTGSNFRYIPDGMLVRIIDETDAFYHVNVPTFGGNYYIPKQYINRNMTLSRLNHVVVVDRQQQNQAAFALRENGLDLISYTLCTTGIPGNFSFETTLGNFKAIEKKERFEYLQKGTENVAGYAPFAIRFTGGAYIHGVPVAYQVKNGERIDPGPIEYLHTIGTFPRSNMCVRNFTSHAKFLYNWMDSQNGAVIVIE